MQMRFQAVALLSALTVYFGLAPSASAAQPTLVFADGDAPAEIVVPEPAPDATAEAGVPVLNTRNVVQTADVRLEALEPSSGSAKVTGPPFVRIDRADRKQVRLEFHGGLV